MASAGMDAAKQDEHIQQLNNSLAAAFTAKAAVIPDERLRELMERLETLEELLPDAGRRRDRRIDGARPLGPPELGAGGGARRRLDADAGDGGLGARAAGGQLVHARPRGRSEPVQLAWHGMRKQLSLFVTPQGRCVLFQQHRLASFLQAGLLLPAQDEALTVRATRSALAKLDVDPSRLLN
jgi:uncharacterized coiled-coil protein SlyX